MSTNQYTRLFQEDVKELDERGNIPADLQIPILVDRYIRLFDYDELLGLCSQITKLNTRVSNEICERIWKAKVEYELSTNSLLSLVIQSIREDRRIYISVLLSNYNMDRYYLDIIVDRAYEQGPSWYDIALQALAQVNDQAYTDAVFAEAMMYMNVDMIESVAQFASNDRPFYKQKLRAAINTGQNRIALVLVNKITDSEILRPFLISSINKGLIDVALALVDKVDHPVTLKAALSVAIETDQTEVAVALIDKISDQSILKKYLSLAIKQDNAEVLSALLDKVDDHIMLKVALKRAVKAGRDDLTVMILDKIDDETYIGDDVKEAISQDMTDLVYDIVNAQKANVD